jgi:citrate synthase
VASSVASALGAGIASVRATRFAAIEAAIATTAADGPVRAIDMLDAATIAAAFSTAPYPNGDPRAAVLLDLLEASAPDVADAARRLTDELRRRGAGPPTASFAQAAVAFACEMRPGSTETISLVSRTAGWIAHAIEEHRRPTPYRPRLAYTGQPPRATPRPMLDAVVDYLSRE